jgi:hypothetical protein
MLIMVALGACSSLGCSSRVDGSHFPTRQFTLTSKRAMTQVHRPTSTSTIPSVVLATQCIVCLSRLSQHMHIAFAFAPS